MGDARREVLEAAQQVLKGQLHPFEGCRVIVRRFRQLTSGEANDPVFAVLVGIESETDDLPFGEARKHWSPAALGQKDQEADQYLRQVENQIREACEKIVAKLVSTAPG